MSTLRTEPFPYAIRPVDEGDQDAILALLRLTVGDTSASKKTAAFWRWKHVDNPFGPSYSVCAWDEQTGQVVGLRTLMWWSFRSRDGATVRAVRAVDTATHPDFQRRGIFSALTRYAIEDLSRRGVPFIFNTPNRNSLPGYLKLGWRIVARWPTYVRPVRWGRTAWRLLTARASDADDPSVPPEAALMSWQQFSRQHRHALGELLSRHESDRKQVGYRTERSVAYLDWRYGSHPDVEYRAHAVHDATGLAAVLVVRPARGARGLRAWVVTEMLLREPTAGAGARLLRSFIRASNGDYVAAHFTSGTVERRALARAGFLRAPGRGSTFVARPLSAGSEDPTLSASWDLTLGELEIF